ncbi:hypothetical protein D3C87_1859070 [compost metagenome]
MPEVDVQQRNAENGAVGRDQRQEDAEQAVQRGAGFTYHHFGKLHHKSDDQNKRERSQIDQAQRDQYPGINPPGAN